MSSHSPNTTSVRQDRFTALDEVKREAVRLSVESRASEHALDMTYDENERQAEMHASAQNTADEAANLNFLGLNAPAYQGVNGEEPFKPNDCRRPKEQPFHRFIMTVFRGRAMPLRSVLLATVWSAAAVAITWATQDAQPNSYTKPEDCRWWCTFLAFDSDALSYVGFALFLLTSFRASEAYSRYMEASRTWTNISGTITDFAKYIVLGFPEGILHKGDRERILSFLVAFPIVLKRELRNERDLRELKSVLAESDLARLQNADSMPSYCLYVLSGYMLKARRREHEFPQTFIVQLIRWIGTLASSADVCNQIKVMPSPYSYVTHLNTFLALWLFFLPFALVETSGWFTIIIVAFISYGILGVVTNAVELENPFGSDFNDLPLGRMSDRIQEQVAHIYHTYRDRGYSCIVQLPLDDFTRGKDYWLNKSQPVEEVKTKLTS